MRLRVFWCRRSDYAQSVNAFACGGCGIASPKFAKNATLYRFFTQIYPRVQIRLLAYRIKKIASANALTIFLVPEIGFEPIRCCHRGILSPLRLPVPPLRHT